MGTFTGSRAKSGVSTRFLHEGAIIEYSEYTATATLSAGDVIEMVKVPKGARLADLVVMHNALMAASTGSAAILTVGDGVITNRYMDEISASTSGVQRGIQVNSGVGYEYTADDTIDIKYTDAGTSAVATSAAVFRMIATYFVDGSSSL